MTSDDNRRRHVRRYMLFKIPAYDAETRKFIGLVQDIAEEGVQLFGVKVDVGTSRDIVIQASDYLKTPPIRFQAECRWTRRENPLGYHLCGFRITAISQPALDGLFKLMKFLTLA